MGVDSDNVISPTTKADECAKIISIHSIESHEIVAIGDSFSDIPALSLSDNKFFIDPKNDIDKKCDYPVIDSVYELINIIDMLDQS